jgi:hypothetical protein
VPFVFSSTNLETRLSAATLPFYLSWLHACHLPGLLPRSERVALPLTEAGISATSGHVIQVLLLDLPIHRDPGVSLSADTSARVTFSVRPEDTLIALGLVQPVPLEDRVPTRPHKVPTVSMYVPVLAQPAGRLAHLRFIALQRPDGSLKCAVLSTHAAKFVEVDVPAVGRAADERELCDGSPLAAIIEVLHALRAARILLAELLAGVCVTKTRPRRDVLASNFHFHRLPQIKTQAASHARVSATLRKHLRKIQYMQLELGIIFLFLQ